MEELVGRTLNRYRIVSLLGEGGMGAVFKAYDATLQRDVAIKVLHPHFARRPDFQDRFLQEARTAAKLDHPNIVQVFDFGHDHSYLYIVMKFIPGDDLEKTLRALHSQQKWILLDEACDLIHQISLALDYTHRQGILHRDIKPGNIMIEPGVASGLPYRPILTDLGLAKLVEGGVVTQDGTSMGTPAYMSPEQALGKVTDPRSDVYSLGVLFFELVTGQLPFPARTITEAIQYHAYTPLPLPHTIRPGIPPEIENIVLRCLEKKPENRYESVSMLAGELDSVTGLSKSPQDAPDASHGVVSLFTQYQESLPALSSPPTFEHFDQSDPPGGDRIQILINDKTIKSIAIKKPLMMVGRDPDNDIVLEDRKASRHHIRIETSSKPFRVIDLNSTNGTFLDDKRMVPGETVAWEPENTLRIGDTWFRLLFPGHDLPSTKPQAQAGTTRKVKQTAKASILLSLEVDHLSIDPGSGAAVQIMVQNQGNSLDTGTLSVEGIPSAWVRIPVSTVSLMPGESTEITIYINPPRSGESRSGQFPITVLYTSQQSVIPGRATLILTISGYAAFESGVHPSVIKPGQKGYLKIRNSGNSPERYSVSWHDPNSALSIVPAPQSFIIQGGDERVVEFIARPLHSPLVGVQKRYPFTAQVQPSQGKPHYHDIEVVAKTPIPLWLVPVSLFLCLLLAIVGISAGSSLGAFQYKQAIGSESEPTKIALAVFQTNEAATATASLWLSATEDYQTAATRTAEWLGADDDRDGLTNQQELEINTLPHKRDTDEDGIDDGDELNLYGTDPLNPDSDGDGLKDGDEVARGMNPLSSDSDNDGIPDAQDLSPLQTSTATVDIEATLAAINQATQQVGATLTIAAFQATTTAAAQQTQSAIRTADAAHSATQTAASITQIAYIHNTDQSAANEFKSFLQTQGYVVELVKMDQINTFDFFPFRLLLVGADTGNTSNWGDAAGALANKIETTGKPVLGLGEGGYALFGKLGLTIGWGNGAHGNEEKVQINYLGAEYWNNPIHINIPADQVISLYTSPIDYVGIYLPAPVAEVEQIANISTNNKYYPLVRESGRFFLWGFSGTPIAMTNKGQRVFVNIIEALIP